MIATLFTVIIPAFVVITAGLLLGRFFKPDLLSLNRIALYAAVPALVFVSMAGSELSFANVRILVFGQVLFLGAMLALSWLASWRFEERSRRGFVATNLFGNSANIMLPVTLFAFGEAGLERALVLYVFSAVMLFAFGPLVLARGKGIKSLPLRSVLGLPVLWAALAGITLNVLDWSLPLGLSRGLELLGNAAIPLVLLVLGLQIYQSGVPTPTSVNWVAAGLKLVIGPLIGYATGWLVGARELDLAILTLLGAMPPAVNNFMLALEFGGKAEEVARTIVLATFLTPFSLALVVAALLRFFSQ